MFDLLVVTVVGFSTLFAALRGGLRELSTLLSLAIAGGLTLVLIEPLLAISGQAGSFIATAGLSVILLIFIFIIAHLGLHLGLRKFPLHGRAALLDRVGGGIFGLGRGLVLIGLGYLGYTYYLDETRQPDSVKNAITLPVAASMASWFESFAPESTILNAPVSEGEDVGASSVVSTLDPSVTGYNRTDRNTISEIVTTVTTTDPITNEKDGGENLANERDVIAGILGEDQNQ